ncbi:hypothetical protein GDO86_014015 [Hymenochirus boettgeri]|uniref:Fringe-like glycosyltransferase domain-containing protein n=1 Tax=Hymenochirus boettgeri TaxID=247094 RepID=A0A8T2JSS4_9PIPI|nr:hypothetical protein GDO86_014015 [Hymenochirus boettgeri]
MNVSCIGLGKICFLVSLLLCAALVLFIPWSQRGLSPQHSTLPCNSTRCHHEFLELKLQQTDATLLAGHQTAGLIKRRESSSGQTFIFTDWEDQELRKKAATQMVNTNCSSVHTRQALCCKMAVEYDKFVLSDKKWFCHLDDDNYLNLHALLKLLSAFSHSTDVYVGRPSLDHPVETVDRVKGDGMASLKFWFATGGAGFCISRGLALKMSPWASMGNFISTAEKVRLPDDCTIGYIIEGMLEVKMQHSNLFHSHLENLQRLPPESLLNQVTLSYGGTENKWNVVKVNGAFSLEQDPTRFKSVHCLLYPDTNWCPYHEVQSINKTSPSR